MTIHKYLLLIIAFFTGLLSSFAQTWQPLGNGLSNMVQSLAYDSAKNLLYVGGQFTNADGKPAKYIASWDGTAWSALGSGMDNPVRTLALINDTLYVGGEFTVAGGTSAKCIAKWDGTNWKAIGKGMLNSGQHAILPSVNAIAEYKGFLYASGSFDYADSNIAYFIARWDGNAWRSVGGGLNGSSGVYAMAIYKDELFVAGGFTLANGKSVNKIVSWDGTDWKSPGIGITSSSGASIIYALAVYKDELYATGVFNQVGGKSATNIAKWDGTNWTAVGSGIDKPGLTLTVLNDELYVGGLFKNAGNKPTNYLAKWNGTDWISFENSTSNTISTLVGLQKKNSIIAGGLFSKAGTVSVNNIAELSFTTGINENNNKSNETLNFNVYPNPFSSSCTISLSDNLAASQNVCIVLYNILGLEVRKINLKGQKEIRISRENLPDGIYYASFIHNGNRLSTKKIIIN